MVRVFCDICKKEIPDEGSECRIGGYDEYLKKKGEGTLLIDISKVFVDEKDPELGPHYYTKAYHICDECNEAIVRAVIDLIGNA